VYSRFVQWQEEGLFNTILKELSEEADFQDMSIDSGLPPVFVPTSELVKTVSWHPHSFIGLATS
jgi:hypothetical protein